MLHPNTIIEWIDVGTQEIYKNSIQKMFQMYSHLADSFGDEIRFHESEDQRGKKYKKNVVKISDWTGWTDLLCLRRESIIKTWMLIKFISADLEIISHHKIPIYNPDNITKGFHGETKYEYKIVRIEDLGYHDYIRTRFTESGFSNPSMILYKNRVDPIDKYSISTKSKFFNANGFYLYND